MSDVIDVVGRSINTITAEIGTILTQNRMRNALDAIEIGRRLVEAKGIVGHGEWGSYLQGLEGTLGFKSSKANNCMRLFEEYGSSSDLHALGNLGSTKLVALLSLPGEEREQFLAENDVAGMTTRELQKTIQERDAAQKLLSLQQSEYADLKEQNANLAQRLERANIQLAKATKDADVAARKLEAVRRDPEIPAEKAAALREEGRCKGVMESAEKLTALAEAKREVELARDEIAAELNAIRDRLAFVEQDKTFSDNDVAVFEYLTSEWTETSNRIIGYLKKIKVRDPKLAEGLRAWMQDALLKTAQAVTDS